LLTWPLARQLSTVLPHDLGDPLFSTSMLWWNAHVTPLTARWWDGFSFFPAGGTLAYSDHRLGESLLASPLQWAGAGAVTAYNITLLATFPLCAIAGYWLGFVLTGRHDAALVSGLAFGFNPYRMAHIEHLELLAAFGMPMALAALHRYAHTRRRSSLAALTIALVLQALCSTYYALFFTIVVMLWMVWFLRWTDRHAVLAILIACACAAVILAPIGIGYWRLQTQHDLARSFIEIQTYSADLSSWFTASPLIAVWRWTAPWNGPERQLFPGSTVIALTTGGLFLSRSRSPRRAGFNRVGRWLLIVSSLFAAAALWVSWIGPWSVTIAGIRISAHQSFKPTTVAMAAFAVAIACHGTVQDAFRRRSPFAFYIIATIALMVLSLGPTPSFLGAQFLYRPPYAWLMELPLFAHGVRAPARFAMPAMLTLSAAAALAYAHLAVMTSRRQVILPLLVAGFIADTWITGLALPPVPGPLPAVGNNVAAILSLPFGDAEQEAAAVYRALQTGRKSVNGMGGYDPLHYAILRLALTEGDDTALDVVAEHGPLLIAVDTAADLKRGWRAFVQRQVGIERIREDSQFMLFALPGRDPAPGGATGPRTPIVAAWDDRGPLDLRPLVDDDPATGWYRPDVQFPGEMLVVDVGAVTPLVSVDMSLGRNGETYPRRLGIATSTDADHWTPIFSGQTGGRAYRAALGNPRDVRLTFSLAGTPARFVRLRIEERAATSPWFVSDLAVYRKNAVE